MDFITTSQQVFSELGAVFARLDDEAPRRIVAAIMQSRRITCHGVGREGLQMRGLAMRLMHLGFDAHYTGEMTAPPLNAGDLLIASDGPGKLATVITLMNVARGAGARVMVITSQPESKATQAADDVIVIPAQTLATEVGGSTSVLPMGSLFELAQHLFFDLVALELQQQTEQTEDQIRRRHTNLE